MCMGAHGDGVQQAYISNGVTTMALILRYKR